MKKKKLKEIEHEESSGNVFADLGIPNPEEALARIGDSPSNARITALGK